MAKLSGLLLLLLLPLCLDSLLAVESRDLLSRQLHDSNAYLTKEEHWFDQTLDHFSPTDHRKFGQRFYEYVDFFEVAKGPIFLKICGESACNGIVNDYLSSSAELIVNPKGSVEVLLNSCSSEVKLHELEVVFVIAKKFGAAIVSLEHRYYGKSSPFKELTTANLRFLSSKQALFDLAVFRQYYQGYLNVNYNLSRESPWFVFGVSYSGALSAWFRLKFPHLTCGSLASSAVVLAVYNFTEFDQQVGESAGAECKSALQQITYLVDEELKTDSKSVKNLFAAAELKNDVDFLYLLADAAAIAFQYGNPDVLCSPIVDAMKNGKNLLVSFSLALCFHMIFAIFYFINIF
ncbi:hypothetical protein ZIOFF_022290 [Zingiber officinale]|uniref:Serine protease EDA2 n=1 Tax=Zingiber officinale TaxID=94328 RepID=A0A8J5LMN2_ZINOF|nr:hypothetical protein ZIOFF_022290 [Zingiber officinale]